MKRFQALIAAVIITALVGAGMLAIGANALLNPNTVVAANAPASSTISGGPTTGNASAAANTSPAAAQAQIQQLQNLVAQYQSREQQYQALLNQDQAQLQQYQALLNELQRRGIIRVNGDGTIQLRQRSFFEQPGG